MVPLSVDKCIKNTKWYRYDRWQLTVPTPPLCLCTCRRAGPRYLGTDTRRGRSSSCSDPDRGCTGRGPARSSCPLSPWLPNTRAHNTSTIHCLQMLYENDAGFRMGGSATHSPVLSVRASMLMSPGKVENKKTTTFIYGFHVPPNPPLWVTQSNRCRVEELDVDHGLDKGLARCVYLSS